MANVMILGDTWGIVPCHTYSVDKGITEWFEYQFLKKGHATFNKSMGGNQNHYQLVQAEVFMEATKGTQFELDLIVWFHTEIVRDLIPPEVKLFETMDYDSVIDITAERMYKDVSRLKGKFPNTKWAILGGHAPLRTSKKHLLDWAEFRIDNLRAKIAGVEIPESQAFEFLERGKGSLWDWPAISDEIIQRELVIKEQIIAATKDPFKFYNGKHPAVLPLKNLAHEIMEHFNL
jgi:hypothetical protein